MMLTLERRPERSQWMAMLSPLLAVTLTAIVGAVIFAAQGIHPGRALYVYFIDPLTTSWSLEELAVKSSPLILIGVGLAVCFKAKVWNIGAEGQLTAGALAGAAVPILLPTFQSPPVLAVMIVLAIAGGALYGAIPALLKTRFGANEILTSLMLVYVAQLLLDWLVRGPWRDPNGFNFPQSAAFEGWQVLPHLGDGRLHLGIVFALVAAMVLSVVMDRTLKGFEIKVIGAAPRAGGFAGFSANRTVWFCFLLSGALAGVAGLCEVAGPSGHLQPVVSPGYGFTAIIVAFLGRLNPLGVVLAGVVLGLSYLGGEGAQIDLGVSDKTTQVFQGILLFFILACDTLILYRLRWRAAAARC